MRSNHCYDISQWASLSPDEGAHCPVLFIRGSHGWFHLREDDLYC
jgi:hypothetical protein